MNQPIKTVEELERELAEAERITAGVREQLERARWLQDYEAAEEKKASTPTPAIDAATLVAQLNATFPGIGARLITEADQPDAPGIAVHGFALMPDGLPIYSTIYTDSQEYDGSLHTGFSAWCEARGWYVEPYDGARLDLVRIADAEEVMDEWAKAWASTPAPATTVNNQEPDLPF